MRAFGSAIERLMLPKLLEQDHREQARTSAAPGDHMGWCRNWLIFS
jgi:hypothetical protein